MEFVTPPRVAAKTFPHSPSPIASPIILDLQGTQWANSIRACSPNQNGAWNLGLYPNLVAKIQAVVFVGRSQEDPYAHVHNFEEICSTYPTSEFLMEEVTWKLFFYSLDWYAKGWYQSFINRKALYIIENPTFLKAPWNDLNNEVIEHLFPLEKYQYLLAKVKNITQGDEESIWACWKRFMTLIFGDPRIDIPKERLWIYFVAVLHKDSAKL